MAWLPGITTLEAGNLFRNPNQQGVILSENQTRSQILAPQYTKYGLFDKYLGDILTIQKITPPVTQNAQVTKIDTLTKMDMLPRNQLSDLIAMRMANNEEA